MEFQADPEQLHVLYMLICFTLLIQEGKVLESHGAEYPRHTHSAGEQHQGQPVSTQSGQHFVWYMKLQIPSSQGQASLKLFLHPQTALVVLRFQNSVSRWYRALPTLSHVRNGRWWSWVMWIVVSQRRLLGCVQHLGPVIFH